MTGLLAMWTAVLGALEATVLRPLLCLCPQLLVWHLRSPQLLLLQAKVRRLVQRQPAR
jgi:hypothetical protein